jgi:hypothetical protein
MDKNRVKKMCESLLNVSYSGTKIIDFEIVPTNKYDIELDKWVPNSHTLFIQLSRPNLTEKFLSSKEIELTIEGVFGFECCAVFI